MPTSVSVSDQQFFAGAISYVEGACYHTARIGQNFYW